MRLAPIEDMSAPPSETSPANEGTNHGRVASVRKFIFTVIVLPQRSPDSVADQNRNARVREHLRGRAAEQDRGNPGSSVRGHDDEIAALVRGGRDDRFMRVVMLDLHGVTRDAGR